jgi:cullin 3
MSLHVLTEDMALIKEKRNAYNMTLYKHGQTLYDRVKSTISDYLLTARKSRIDPSLPNDLVVNTTQELDFLKKLKELWEEHGICLRMIRDVLMYLDRTFVKTEKLPDVYSLGQNVFRDSILHHPLIQKSLVGSLLHQIKLERDGERVEASLLKRIIEMLMDFDDGQGTYRQSLSSCSSLTV